MTNSQKIHLAKDLNSYFESEVANVARKQGLNVSPFAQRYLAGVLSRFANANEFLQKSTITDGKNAFPSIFSMWLEGLTQSMGAQMSQMQLVGDLTLFTTGFFSEKLHRSSIDMDFYVAMGGKAYERAGHLRESIAAERALNVFFELAENFSNYVEVFAEISDQSLLSNDTALLKLYEKWLNSGSGRIHRMLAENGVVASAGKGDSDYS